MRLSLAQLELELALFPACACACLSLRLRLGLESWRKTQEPGSWAMGSSLMLMVTYRPDRLIPAGAAIAAIVFLLRGWTFPAARRERPQRRYDCGRIMKVWSAAVDLGP